MIQKKLLLTLALALLGGAGASAADYNMQPGDDHVVQVAETFYLYDDGGADNGVTTGFKGSVLLKPAVADKAVKLNTVEFAVSSNRLMIYHGDQPTADAAVTANGYFVSTGPKDIVSEAADGSLLLRFSGNKDYTKGTTGKPTAIKGFKIEVSLTDMPKKQEEPMSGTYRVGTSADARFRNLTELQTAMAVGLGGPTVIELEDGIYDEALHIKDLPGASATNTLTITSVAGSPDGCVISGPVTPLDNRGILCIEGTPYVTVKDITVATNEGNGSRYPYAGLHLRDGSHHCTVSGCTLMSPVSTLTGQDNRTFVLLATGCDDLTVSGNRFDGGYTAIYVGTDPETYEGPTTAGLTIRDNSITDVAVNAIKLHSCDAFTVSGNSIVPGSIGRKTAYFIDMWNPSGAFAVTANRLLIEQATESTVVNVRRGAGAPDATRPAIIANNVIAYPKATAPYTFAMAIDASVANLLVAHNSINVASTATSVKNIYGIAFNGNAPAEGAPRVVNNIIRTAASGCPLRPWNDTHYANITFAHNIYYAAAGAVDGDGKDFAAYQAATGDDSSVWLDPQYLSDSDLHLAEVDRSEFMPRLEAVTVDYAGAQRTDPTTAGAYEYEIPAPDAPAIAEGYPQVGVPTAKGVEIKTRWSIGGKLYVKAVATSAEAPDAAAVMTGQPAEIEADKEVVSALTGLQPSTEYRAYFVVESALGAVSAVVPSDAFTTLEDIQPLDALIFWQDEPFEAGQTVELMAYVEGGKKPYTYSWVDQSGAEVSTADYYTYTAERSLSFHLTVKSADGQTVICKDDIPVISAALMPATFEDLYLAAESCWMYDEALSTGGLYNDTFFSGSLCFPNSSMTSYAMWGGYGYANQTSTDFKTLDDQMHNAAGGGAAGTAAYAVSYAYGSPTEMTLQVPAEGVDMPGLYVTNSAYTLSSIVNGDGYSPKFESGDYQEVVFEGLLGGQSTGTVTVSLADYRLAEPTVLTDWQYVDLSTLGKITSLKFSLQGNKSTTVPAYLCLDQIGAANPAAGIAGAASSAAGSISMPARGCLSVTGIASPATLRIYSIDGRCRAEHRIAGATTVSVAALPAGTYIATVDGAPAYRFAR